MIIKNSLSLTIIPSDKNAKIGCSNMVRINGKLGCFFEDRKIATYTNPSKQALRVNVEKLLFCKTRNKKNESIIDPIKDKNMSVIILSIFFVINILHTG